MIYRFFWLIGQFVFQAFVRRLFYVGSERFPHKPLFIAANHPNSFLDGMIINLYMPKAIFSLVRGDVFRSPVARWWLRQFKLEPIFRAQDVESTGDNLKKNEETLEACQRILQKNGAINIFVEGLSVQEKRLRPIRKGLARMALQAESESGWTLDTHIMPVGVNYTQFGNYDMEIMVEFGEPFPVGRYREVYAENPNRAIKQLQAVIEQGVKPLVIHIARPDMDAPAEPLLEIARHQLCLWRMPWKIKNPARFLREKAVADWINDLALNHPEQWQSVADQSLAYQQQLTQARLNEHTLATRASSWPTDLLATVLLLPFAATGALIHAIPYALIRTFAKKFKGTVFYDSVNVGGAMGLHSLWMVIVALACLPFSWIAALAAVFMVPLTLLLCRSFFLAQRRMGLAIRYWRLSAEKRNALHAMRNALVAVLPKAE